LFPYLLFAQNDTNSPSGDSSEYLITSKIEDYHSPNDENSTLVSETPIVTPSGGFYTDSVLVQVSGVHSNTEIYYSLNGSEPTQSSFRYTKPIIFTKTSIFRIRTYRPGYPPGAVFTHTYLINPSFSLPVVSMVTEYKHLWGSTGIYANPRSGSERPVHIEFFKPDGTLSFSLDGGMRIHAPDGKRQKSFRLYARPEYGTPEINCHIFPDKNIRVFKRLILRNAANDGLQMASYHTHIRDGLLHILYNKIDGKTAMSSFLMVHVYLNGEYWGIYNLRERQDKHYIESNFGETGIDFLERAFGFSGNMTTIEGDWDHYNRMKAFIDSADLSLSTNYEYVKTQMDVEDFLDYWMFEIYSGNYDWLSNNIRFWRARTHYAKWRWVLWDLDHGLGLPFTYAGVQWGDPSADHLDRATGSKFPRTFSGRNTIIIRNLLDNTEARNYFNIRFADLLNSTLSSDYVLGIIDSMYALLSGDVMHQIDRWGGSLGAWNGAIERVRNYVIERPGYVRMHIQKKFKFDAILKIRLDGVPLSGGKFS